METKSVLLTMTKPPPMEVTLPKSMKFNCSLFSMVKSPPIEVTNEKSNSSTLDSKKPADLLMAMISGMEMEETE